jgi:nucleoside triphosphate diphosphatase
VVEAIDLGDEVGLRDELGDLLLNLAFQVVLAEEREVFDRHAVVLGLEAKMRRRHPHLYGLGDEEPWESVKARERPEAPSPAGPLLDDLPPDSEPLQRAHRIQARVAGVGFDWPDARGAWAKLREEVEEVGAELEAGDASALEEELGDLLFAVVNVARLSGVHAPTALATANAKFVRRFGRIERLAAEQGVDMATAGLARLDELWEEVKRGER